MALSNDVFLQVIAAATALFIGLLPVTYMNWRERFLTMANREYQAIRGLGNWMNINGISTINFLWGFGRLKITHKTNITKPESLIKHLENLPKGFEYRRYAPIDQEAIIGDGVNIFANKVLSRAYHNFIIQLFIQSFLLVGSTLLISVYENATITIPYTALVLNTSSILIIILLSSVISYLVYAVRTFRDYRIRWYTDLTQKNGEAILMTWELWHSP